MQQKQHQSANNNLLDINFSQSVQPQIVQQFNTFQGFNQGFGTAAPIPVANSQLPFQFSNDPPQRLHIKLQDNERGYYSAQLHRADPSDSNKVKGKDAVNFFMKSGLSKEILKKIWDLSSTNGEFLDRDEFYVALKLISYAQNNIDVSASSINQNLPSPLPQFNAKVDDNKQQAAQSQAPVNPIGGGGGASAATSISFEIDKAQLDKYEAYYTQSDTQKKGVLSGAEAKQIFMKSGLNNNILMLIWSLSDRTQKGYLSKVEFIVAVHLIKLAKNNVEIPTKLPDSIVLFMKEYEALHPTTIQSESLPIQKDNSSASNDAFSFASQSVGKADISSPKSILSQNQLINELAPQTKSTTSNSMQATKDDKYSAFNSSDIKNESTIIKQQPQQQQKVSDLLGSESFFKDQQQVKISLTRPMQSLSQQMQGESGLEGKLSEASTKIEETKSMLNETQKGTGQIFNNLRQFHEGLLKEKNEELNFFTKLLDAYQTLNKKIIDENSYMQEEIKKIEDKKGEVLANLTKLGKEMNQNINRSSQLRKQIIETTSQSVNEIVHSANQTIENIVNIQNELNKSEMEQLQQISPVHDIQLNRKSSITNPPRKQSNFKALEEADNKQAKQINQGQSDVTWRRESYGDNNQQQQSTNNQGFEQPFNQQQQQQNFSGSNDFSNIY